MHNDDLRCPSCYDRKRAEERAEASLRENPLRQKRGLAGQRHWQEGWEAAAVWVFERIAEGDPIAKVRSDADAILSVADSESGKRRPSMGSRLADVPNTRNEATPS